ncbi:MAG: TIGR04255 family protein [Mariniphaga sp.]|nr:TIGR04255 family protein [Mariniphaga sp.]
MNLPKKIDPCPIVESLIEIRFLTNTHPNAVFGLIYKSLQNVFPKVENLDITQIPETIRNAEPGLKFKPHYKLSNENFICQVGPDVISLASYPHYWGWERFSQEFLTLMKILEKIGIIKSISRLGIRYINFFEADIFENIKLKISLENENMAKPNTGIRTIIEQGSFSSLLQIANNVKISEKEGSVIDIDTYCTEGLDVFFQDTESIIQKGHEKEKELFFQLLTDDFLNTLNPEY